MPGQEDWASARRGPQPGGGSCTEKHVRTASRVEAAVQNGPSGPSPAQREPARGSGPSLERMWARGLPRGLAPGPVAASALEPHCAGGLGRLVRPGVARLPLAWLDPSW